MGARDGLRCQRPSMFSFTLLANFLSTTNTDISTFCTIPRRLRAAPSLEVQNAAASKGSASSTDSPDALACRLQALQQADPLEAHPL